MGLWLPGAAFTVLLAVLAASSSSASSSKPYHPPSPPWSDSSCHVSESHGFNESSTLANGVVVAVGEGKPDERWYVCDPFKMTLRWEVQEINRILLSLMEKASQGESERRFSLSVVIGDRRKIKRKKNIKHLRSLILSRLQNPIFWRQRNINEKDSQSLGNESQILSFAMNKSFVPRLLKAMRAQEQWRQRVPPSLLPYGARLQADDLLESWNLKQNSYSGGVVVLSTQARKLAWKFHDSDPERLLLLNRAAMYCMRRARSPSILSDSAWKAPFQSYSYQMLSIFLRCLARYVEGGLVDEVPSLPDHFVTHDDDDDQREGSAEDSLLLGFEEDLSLFENEQWDAELNDVSDGMEGEGEKNERATGERQYNEFPSLTNEDTHNAGREGEMAVGERPFNAGKVDEHKYGDENPDVDTLARRELNEGAAEAASRLAQPSRGDEERSQGEGDGESQRVSTESQGGQERRDAKTIVQEHLPLEEIRIGDAQKQTAASLPNPLSPDRSKTIFLDETQQEDYSSHDTRQALFAPDTNQQDGVDDANLSLKTERGLKLQTLEDTSNTEYLFDSANSKPTPSTGTIYGYPGAATPEPTAEPTKSKAEKETKASSKAPAEPAPESEPEKKPHDAPKHEEKTTSKTSLQPTLEPTAEPTKPTLQPTTQPTKPTPQPTTMPTLYPTAFPTFEPTKLVVTVSPTQSSKSGVIILPPGPGNSPPENPATPEESGPGSGAGIVNNGGQDTTEEEEPKQAAWKRWLWVCIPMIVIIIFGFALFSAGWGQDSGVTWGIHGHGSFGRPDALRKMGGVYEKSALRSSNEPDYVTFAHETASSRTQWRDMNYNRWHAESKPNSEAYGLADDGFYYPTDNYQALGNPLSEVEPVYEEPEDLDESRQNDEEDIGGS